MDLTQASDPPTRHVYTHTHTNTHTPTIAIGENETRCIPHKNYSTNAVVLLIRLTYCLSNLHRILFVRIPFNTVSAEFGDVVCKNRMRTSVSLCEIVNAYTPVTKSHQQEQTV